MDQVAENKVASSKLVYLNTYLAAEVNQRARVLERFRQDAQEMRLDSLLVATAEQVFVAVRVHENMKGMLKYLHERQVASPEAPMTVLAELRTVVEHALEEIVESLVGTRYAGDGPWRHNSTSYMENLLNLCACTAKREEHRALAHVMRTLDSEEFSP